MEREQSGKMPGRSAARLRKWNLGACLVVLFLTWGPEAGGAVELAYQATLKVDVLDDLFPMEASANGVAVVDDSTGAFSLPAALFRVETSGVFDETTPRDIIPANVLGVDVEFENGPGSFGPSLLDGGYGGSMGTPGSFDFYGDDPLPFVLPLILDSLGAGGSDSASSLGGLVTTTLVGDLYRTGTATVDDVAVGDMLGQSISRTGFDMRAADWTGALRMVAPARATIDGGMLFGVDVPIFATLDVTFVAAPEPAAAAMFALALAGLACRFGIGRPR